ncbi:MAG: hypothetical protein QXS19_08430, partial [Candidatus Methanomethylicia archaeon]
MKTTQQNHPEIGTVVKTASNEFEYRLNKINVINMMASTYRIVNSVVSLSSREPEYQVLLEIDKDEAERMNRYTGINLPFLDIILESASASEDLRNIKELEYILLSSDTLFFLLEFLTSRKEQLVKERVNFTDLMLYIVNQLDRATLEGLFKGEYDFEEVIEMNKKIGLKVPTIVIHLSETFRFVVERDKIVIKGKLEVEVR